jgi:hypothetical protein
MCQCETRAIHRICHLDTHTCTCFEHSLWYFATTPKVLCVHDSLQNKKGGIYVNVNVIVFAENRTIHLLATKREVFPKGNCSVFGKDNQFVTTSLLVAGVFVVFLVTTNTLRILPFQYSL